jgi:flagellar hook-length control protein FliK
LSEPATLPPALMNAALPALAGVGPAGGPPGIPSALPAAPGASGSNADFSALLLGLQPAVVPAATSQATLSIAPPAAIDSVWMPDQSDPSSLPPDKLAAADERLPDGTALPVDGTALPPPAIAGVLEALVRVPTAAIAPAPAAVPANDITPAVAPPAQTGTTTPAAPETNPTAIVANGAVPTDPDTPHFADATAAVDAAEEPAPDRTGDSTTQSDTATPTTGTFRQRLDHLLQSLDRAPTSSEPASSALTSGIGATAERPIRLHAPSSDLPFDRLPALQPAGDTETFTQGLGDRLLMMADKALQSATIRLQPESMGPMEIRIAVDDDGAARVVFSAQHGQTREALEAALPRLRELLAEQGLALQQASVDSGRSGFASRGWYQPESTADAIAWRGAESGSDEALSTPWTTHRLGHRRLDVLA